MFSAIKETLKYRQMINSLVRRDLRGRYKGSVLGFLWTFINPLLQLVVYTFIFSFVFTNNINEFYLYVFVGLIPWIFFSTCLTAGPGAVLDQQNLVTKVYFPREVLPISFVTSQFVNMLYCFVIVMAVVIFSAFTSFANGIQFVFPPINPDGNAFSFLPLVVLPLIFLIQYILCLGVTFLISAITVYLRDLKHFLGILGMLWMFATPVMYRLEDHTGEKMAKFGWIIYYLNPMTGLIDAYHHILYYGDWPNFFYLIAPIAWSIGLLIIGYLVFEKAKKRFAEEM